MDDLLRYAPCGFLSFADNGAILQANATLAQWLGHEPAALAAMRIEQLLPAGARLFYQTYLSPLLKLHGKVEEIALTLHPAEGEDLPVLLSGARRERDGQMVNDCVMLVVRQRSRYEEELLLAKKAAEEAHHTRVRADKALLELQKLESMGTLAGGVAHDFNNLLAAMLGSAELALLDLGPEHVAHSSVTEILAAGRRAADLTGKMLAYSGRGRLAVAPLDLADLVRTVDLLLPLSAAPGVSVELQLDERLPALEADAGQLRQLLVNLVQNAAEAMGQKSGRVMVRLGLRRIAADYLAACYLAHDAGPGEYLALEVADEGTGMSEATRSRIFEPFFTTKFTGRGLGMAAVLGIVRAHQGAIRVTSHQGWGTTVTVLLPPMAAAAAAPSAPGPELAEPATKVPATALVIDDEPALRAVVRRLLVRIGYGVLDAPGGQEGLDLLEKRPDISCVLLDLTMPGLSGEETLRRIRARRPALPVVIMSGYTADEIRERLDEPQSVGVLEKPFRLADLRRVIGEVVTLDVPLCVASRTG
jgi:two-component system cell cycle sensor histidine kinase/response regulator CckA